MPCVSKIPQARKRGFKGKKRGKNEKKGEEEVKRLSKAGSLPKDIAFKPRRLRKRDSMWLLKKGGQRKVSLWKPSIGGIHRVDRKKKGEKMRTTKGDYTCAKGEKKQSDEKRAGLGPAVGEGVKERKKKKTKKRRSEKGGWGEYVYNQNGAAQLGLEKTRREIGKTIKRGGPKKDKKKKDQSLGPRQKKTSRKTTGIGEKHLKKIQLKTKARQATRLKRLGGKKQNVEGKRILKGGD